MKKLALSFFYSLCLCSVLFAQESKQVKILEQPKPELPKDYGTLDAQGTIMLLVEFLENGQIGKVSFISGLSVSNLKDNAIEAAKKIKFEPAIKDGKPVTVSKVIAYGYSWNGFWKIPAEESAQNPKNDEKAEAIVKKAVENLGGEKYLQVKSQIGRGKFHIMRDGLPLSYQTFLDVIVFPDKERTEFKFVGTVVSRDKQGADYKLSGVKNVQTNTGDAGWFFDGAAQVVNDQTAEQIGNFKLGMRVSLDQLLRGYWRGKAKLVYVGKREAGIGKRNEVVKLTFDDGFTAEFEFSSSDGMPMKAFYKRKTADNEDVKEEDRYAQFVDVQGVKTPFIIDHYSNNVQTSRINYESMEFNKSVSDSIFAKPNSVKELKKDLKL